MNAETLDALIARVPEIACKGLCAKSCGPLFVHLAELQLIEQKVGVIPHDVVEVEDASVALVHTDRKLRCAKLRNGRCTIYEHRPLICRLWGVVDTDAMRCPWGCVPDRWLSDGEARELLRATRDETR